MAMMVHEWENICLEFRKTKHLENNSARVRAARKIHHIFSRNSETSKNMTQIFYARNVINKHRQAAQKGTGIMG